MATAVGDPAELLDVDVEQLAGPIADIADRDARRPVAIAQAGQAMAAEDVADRRARAADHRGEAVRPEAELVAGGPDRRELVSGQCPRRTIGSPAAILQPDSALAPRDGDPLRPALPARP